MKLSNRIDSWRDVTESLRMRIENGFLAVGCNDWYDGEQYKVQLRKDRVRRLINLLEQVVDEIVE